MKKKIISLLLTFCMILSLFPALANSALAGYTTYYSIENGKTGQRLYSNEVYRVLRDTSCTDLRVLPNATVVIYIAPGVTLSVTGKDGADGVYGWTGGGVVAKTGEGGHAAINLPTSSTLIVCGGGTLVATGGDGGAPSKAQNGGDGVLIMDLSDEHNQRVYANRGEGGDGGHGGGGGGAGIGGNGGIGGNAGWGGESMAFNYNYNGNANYYDDDGNDGYAGKPGAAGEAMGNLYILNGTTVNATGGEGGTALTARATAGRAKIDYDSGLTYNWAAGGGGGGGGGSGDIDTDYDDYYLVYGYGGKGAANGGLDGRRGTYIPTHNFDANLSEKGGSGGSGGKTGAYGSNGTTEYVNTHSAIEYTAWLDAQNESGASDGVIVTTGMPMPKITVPTKTGYEFIGYFISKNGVGTQYYDAKGVSTHVWNHLQNRTLYAHWKPISYTHTVTCDDTMGTVSGGGSTDFDKEFTITATPKAGYRFTNWSDGSISPSQTLTQPAYDTSFTAYFELIPPTLGNWTRSVSLTNIPYGYQDLTMVAKVTEPDTEYYDYSYQWYEAASDTNTGGTAISGATGKTLSIPTGRTPGAYYFYCVQTATPKETGDIVSTSSACATFSVVNAPQAAPDLEVQSVTRKGLSDGRISGLTTDMELSTNNGESYSDCTVTELTGLSAESSYYVRYKAHGYYAPGEPQIIYISEGLGYSVSFHKNIGPSNGQTSFTSWPEEMVDLSHGAAASLGVPTSDYLTFRGWYTDPECTREWVTETPITADLDLYAKWDGKEYTIELDNDGDGVSNGVGDGTITFEYGKRIPESIDIPTKPGFTFGGYFGEPSGLPVQYYDRYGERVLNDQWVLGDGFVYSLKAHWLEQSSELESFSLRLGETIYPCTIITPDPEKDSTVTLCDTIRPTSPLPAGTVLTAGNAVYSFKNYSEEVPTQNATVEIIDGSGEATSLSDSGEYDFSDGVFTILATAEDGENSTRYTLELSPYRLAPIAAQTDYSPGETVSVNILARGVEEETRIGSFAFNLQYDAADLTLTGITSTLGELTTTASHAEFTASASDSGPTLPKNGIIATASFTVNSGMTAGESELGLENVALSMNSSPVIVAAEANIIGLHDIIRLTFSPGEGVEHFETVTGWARYGRPGVYGDEACKTEFIYPAATAANGYVLYDTASFWLGTARDAENDTDGSAYFSAADIGARLHSQSVTYTAVGRRPSPSSIPSSPISTSKVPLLIDGENKTDAAVSFDDGQVSVKLDEAASKLLSGDAQATLKLPPAEDATKYVLELPASALSGTDTAASLTLETELGSVRVPAEMLTGTENVSADTVSVNIEKTDLSQLTEDVRTAIGDRPVISLSLAIDGKAVSWSNPDAPVRVSLPYSPTAEELENPESIVIWYIDGEGNAVCVPNGHYDPMTKSIVFTTTHFSDFAVTYVPAAFDDVSQDAWYKEAVTFIAAREITNGTGDGKFSPNAELTRGQLMVLLMRAFDLAPEVNPSENFLDAGDTYYTGYLAAARRLGIAAGVGNNLFAPERAVSREELFTLLYNTLYSLNQLPEVSGQSGSLESFADADKLSDWAKEALAYLVGAGTVKGDAGKLSPSATATRAQLAQVLYRLIGK